MFKLTGKTALVTGASGGIGSAIAKALHSQGAEVILSGTREGVLTDLADQLAIRTHVIAADLKDPKSIESLVQKAELVSAGGVDIVVNNAGIAVWGTNDDTTEEIWDTVMNVNAKGVFLGTKHVIPEMKKSGGGSIINISSISGLVGQPTIQPVYNASKGAVRIFTKSTAVQYGRYGIRANSIHPGAIDTDMISHRIQGEENKNRIKNTVPLQRVAKPIEIAYGALFLASDESSYMTGSEMVIDGGVTAGAPNTSVNS